MIAEGAVLLAVKRFEQCGGRVAPVVRAELIDLVEHEHGIPGAGLLNAGDDAPRHRADIGLPVAADLRFVVHAAEGDAGAFPVRCAGTAHGDARFADARRPYETEHPALDLRGELPYGKILQYTVLDLRKTVVILIQNLFRVGDIGDVLRPLVPRKLKADVKIGPQHRAFRRPERLLGETGELLEKLFLDLRIESEIKDLPAVFVKIVRFGRFPQLLLDHAHLLAQEIVLLIFRHALRRRGLEILLDIHDLQLAVQHIAEHGEPLKRRAIFQKQLLFRRLQKDVLCNVIRDETRLLPVRYTKQGLRSDRSRRGGVLGKEVVARTDKRRAFERVRIDRLIGKHPDICPKRRGLRREAQELRAVQPVNDAFDVSAAGRAQDLAQAADRADRVEIVCAGRVAGDVTLRYKKDHPVGADGGVERGNAHRALHIKVQHRSGKY